MPKFTLVKLGTVASTQLWVKEHLHEIPQKEWLVVTAEQQTAGVGTCDRSWYSPVGNVYVSLATRLFDPHKTQYTQITALSVAQMLEQFGVRPQIKWVNDVLLQGKKISGVLAEIVTNAKRENFLVIGVGINVNLQTVTVPSLLNTITSLALEQKRQFDLEQVLTVFLRFFTRNMDDYLQNRDLLNLTQQITRRLTTKVGEEIMVMFDDKVIEGIFLGLDPTGQLKLQIADKVIVINHGSVINANYLANL